MSYEKNYKLADAIIAHLDTIISGITDDFISSRYVGFVATAAVTSYENAIKDIFIAFAQKKSKSLECFTRSYFDRINGKIKIKHLKNNIAKYGEKYFKRFNKKIEKRENELILVTKKDSLINCYGNIIGWRHKFVHEGKIPNNPTYCEAVKSYQIGKEVIKCLFETMQR